MSISCNHEPKVAWVQDLEQGAYAGVCRSQEVSPVTKGQFLDLGLDSFMVQEPLHH